jgi:hypothetical protein
MPICIKLFAQAILVDLRDPEVAGSRSITSTATSAMTINISSNVSARKFLEEQLFMAMVLSRNRKPIGCRAGDLEETGQ